MSQAKRRDIKYEASITEGEMRERIEGQKKKELKYGVLNLKLMPFGSNIKYVNYQSAVIQLNGRHVFARICQGCPWFELQQNCLNKTSYYFQIQVYNDTIEQSQIIQACGYLAITVILLLGTTLQMVIHSQLRYLSQMERIQSAQKCIIMWIMNC